MMLSPTLPYTGTYTGRNAVKASAKHYRANLPPAKPSPTQNPLGSMECAKLLL
jgi:hypothetical protein